MSDVLSSLRVGRLPYLNAWPFRAGWQDPEPRWVEDAPRRLGMLAAAGALDAAPLASRDAFALRATYRPLADLGIATRGPVESVLLLSHEPVSALAGARIALTGESRTSRGLLRVLLGARYGLRDVEYVEAPAPARARLAIGDAALRARRAGRTRVALDLGAAWSDWTGLPFVWARWVVRRDLPATTVDALARALVRALEAPVSRGPLPRGGPLEPAEARAYLDRFTYRLGPAEQRGLERFHQELLRHDLAGHHERRGLGSAA